VGLLDVSQGVEALRAGHQLPKAEIRDTFIHQGETVLLSRAAAIPNLGQGVKTVTVKANNPSFGLPTVQGAMMLFDPSTGALRALLDSAALTNLKTVADSLLGSDVLARANSEHLVIIGTGSLAGALAEGYAAHRSTLRRIGIFGRNSDKAASLVARLQAIDPRIVLETDLQQALSSADIVATATSSPTPVLDGNWIRPGTHVDLVGAYRRDMREADDTLLKRAKLYVDSRQSTLSHIGELAIPLETGVISPGDILGDYYDIALGTAPERSADDITLCKNGGGAHLDLMIGAALVDAYENRI
jgi:ornithine cyclodeaminase/alanine dehydrogenase-like protein (mu-crystallin family)